MFVFIPGSIPLVRFGQSGTVLHEISVSLVTYDGLRWTQGLRRKLAVFVDDLKIIGYCVNGYQTPLRRIVLDPG